MSHFVTQIHSIKADRPLTQIRIYFKYHKFITARVYTEYTAASVRNMIWSVLKRWNEYMKFNNGISMLLTDLLRISMLDFCFIHFHYEMLYSNRCGNVLKRTALLLFEQSNKQSSFRWNWWISLAMLDSLLL